jgi:CHAD domain-containing protein
LTRGADVGEVAHLRTRRTRRDVTLPDGPRVGELTDDVVWGRARDGGESRFREIEVEVAEDADDRWWSEILERLGDARPVAERPIPKAVRVLGPAAMEPPDVVVPALRPKPTAHEVIQAALASSVAQLLSQLPGARLGTDPEGVHQARVAARRMNSDLKTFKPLLAGDWAGHLRGELRWMIDALGAVRDCDVLAMKLGEVAARHPEIDPAAAERVLHQVDLQRRASRRRLLRCLGDDRAVRLFDELVAVAASPTTRRRAERPAYKVMPKLVRKHWNRLERAIDALDRHPTPAELHAVRILAKRLRYATEAVAPAAGKPARKFAKQAARIQDALGDLNDASVAREWLTATAGHLDGPAGFAAGQLAQTLVAEAHTNDQAWRSAHRSMTRHTAWFI